METRKAAVMTRKSSFTQRPGPLSASPPPEPPRPPGPGLSVADVWMAIRMYMFIGLGAPRTP